MYATPSESKSARVSDVFAVFPPVAKVVIPERLINSVPDSDVAAPPFVSVN